MPKELNPTVQAPSTLVIVPTYNEAANIGRLIEAVKSRVAEADLLVVDDNSPDGTQNLVRERMKCSPRLHLLERPGKQGLAVAYAAGFAWGLARGYDRLVQMDADLSHNPADLPRLLTALDSHDVAIGSRYIKGGRTTGWSKTRELISRGGNLYARAILGMPHSDLTGGFNAWRRSALQKISFAEVRSKGYAFQVELKYRASRAGLSWVEIPIEFREREQGVSKMSGNIVWEAALTVLAMRGRPVDAERGIPSSVPAPASE